jgi:hypothetical protein
MSTAELLEKLQALAAPLQHRVEDFVEALRDQIRTEYGTFPGALSHLRELRDGTR